MCLLWERKVRGSLPWRFILIQLLCGWEVASILKLIDMRGNHAAPQAISGAQSYVIYACVANYYFNLFEGTKHQINEEIINFSKSNNKEMSRAFPPQFRLILPFRTFAFCNTTKSKSSGPKARPLSFRTQIQKKKWKKKKQSHFIHTLRERQREIMHTESCTLGGSSL